MTTTVYVNHRENQRTLILDCAADLFIAKGIEPVTIGKIAKTAKLTRATIYKYFSNKEEIAQAIFHAITERWQERNEREVYGVEGSGYTRLVAFVESFFNYLFEYPREASFVAEINYLYAKHWSAEQFSTTMLENLNPDRAFVLRCLQDGMADGSIRADMDADLLLAVFFNFLSGMISRFGEMGDKVQAEFGISTRTVFTQLYRTFLDGFKTPTATAPAVDGEQSSRSNGHAES